jgi:hypothetical protein
MKSNANVGNRIEDLTQFTVAEFLETSEEPDTFRELVIDGVNFIEFSYDDEPTPTYYPVSTDDIVTIIPVRSIQSVEEEGVLATLIESGESVRIDEEGQVYEYLN